VGGLNSGKRTRNTWVLDLGGSFRVNPEPCPPGVEEKEEIER